MRKVSKLELAERVLRDPRWKDVVTRNREADGLFLYSVRSTRVFCRPSCASRLASPANVRFHRTAFDAEAQGFRACKRCKPTEAPYKRLCQIVTDACRWIEIADARPGLDCLAARAGLSSYYFHRIFKASTGLTPKQYGEAHYAIRVRHNLTHSKSITDAIVESGYSSTSRFYEKARSMLGMLPATYRRHGAGATIRFTITSSYLGALLAAKTTEGVCAILIGENPRALRRTLKDRFKHARVLSADSATRLSLNRAVQHVRRESLDLHLPLDVRRVALASRVWRQITASTTATAELPL